MFTGTQIGQHSISRIANTPFICQQSYHSQTLQYTSDWLYFTRGNGWWSGHIEQAQSSGDYISIAEFPP